MIKISWKRGNQRQNEPFHVGFIGKPGISPKNHD